ncbi:Uncharacterised protein [Cedecea neteri]|uniref:Uncharacterized protein n=1 Tax=Cedecea neteri TaxID=158822 RepID=A0A2X3J3T4_9ENTR|nr:Uncharacterised protein [Cedecea neteri]
MVGAELRHATFSVVFPCSGGRRSGFRSANTLIMAASCEQQHVPVEMHRYSSGGHGFGMGKPGTPTVKWPEHYAKWLAKS